MSGKRIFRRTHAVIVYIHHATIHGEINVVCSNGRRATRRANVCGRCPNWEGEMS